jgi:hypothetical protein
MTKPWSKLSETLPGIRHPEFCQCCNKDNRVDLESDLTIWREHDDQDRETNVFVMLCHNCNSTRSSDGGVARANRKRTMVEVHARLYSEMSERFWFPGIMHLCVNCEWRTELHCHHPDWKANGGAGTLAISGDLGYPVHFKMSRTSESGWSRRYGYAKSCSGLRLKQVIQI